MLSVVEYLRTAGVQFNAEKMKVHLACHNGTEHPIDVFYEDGFKDWQEWQTRRNFQCEHVLSLIDLGGSRWLFVGVYEVLSVKPHPRYPDQYLYKTQLLPGHDDLIGRLIVHHVRSRASAIWYKDGVDLPVVEILAERKSVGDFPGYNSVCISHRNLKLITEQKVESWHGALANISGVYLITDTCPRKRTLGRHYVGKASGRDGIWQRWCDYAANGHGGNDKLKKLLRKRGTDHALHFQYSILEIADTHTTKAQILEREQYWMSVLGTRGELGLN